ncbi:MAG: Nif3-like dinuclear metal center hexameric protein [Bacteroidetes bacterium]|nr:Nif3-like dinuclear metal center hexameric protein [Bacteroidota bacterium]
MKLKIKDITNYLESIAPLAYQEQYDNCGLLVGDKETELTSVLVALDCIEDVVEEAIQKKCNLIVAHHPIIFSGLKKITGKNYIERTILKAIKNDIAIYAMHTNLDNVSNGVNAKIAEKLGLINCKVLAPKQKLLKKIITFCPSEHADKVRAALYEAGAGHIGNYDHCSFNTDGFGTFRALEGSHPFVGKQNVPHQEKEQKIETIFPSYLQSKVVSALFASHPYEEVAYDIISLDNNSTTVGSGMVGELESELSEKDVFQLIKAQLNCTVIRHSSLLGKSIKRIAVCGGSGSFLLNEAIYSDCQLFITADVKYHQFFDADKKIVIADIGHFESEQFTPELIKAFILRKFPTFAVHLTGVNTNSINYF